MRPTSPAPPGEGGRLPPPPQGWGAPGPVEPRLTSAQRSRLTAIVVVLVLIGAGLGLLATAALPHEYAAESAIRYTVGRGADDAERVLATQTVLITGREVLDGASQDTGVPVDYLAEHTTATVVPNSEIITIQVRHRNRATGVQLADAVARRYLALAEKTSPRAALREQLTDLQRRLTSGTVPAAQLPELRARVTATQSLIDDLATTESLASLAAPAYSLPDAVFPNPLVTVGSGALLGLIAAALVGSAQLRRSA